MAPRLLTLSARCRAIDAAVVCPCCLKGSLKEEVRREAARAGGDAVVAQHYPLLMHKLADLVREEGADGGVQEKGTDGRGLEEGADADGGGGVMSVSLSWDAEMLSPKNGFVRAIKVRGGSRAAA